MKMMRPRSIPPKHQLLWEMFVFWDTVPFVEDEWHLFLICPLYAPYRAKLPFCAATVRVEGAELQGDGCTERNLVALTRAILQVADPNHIAEFLSRALAARRRYREALP